MEDRWLSVDKIEGCLDVKQVNIYNWINARNMPAHRVGRLWKLKQAEADVWMRDAGVAETRNNGAT